MSEPDVLRDAGVASRVVRGGAQGVAAFVIGNLLVAVASIFLLRHLGVVDFGRYGTVTALALIVLGLADAGLTITATRDLAVLPRGEDRRAVLRVVGGLRLALTAAGVLAAVLFAVLAGYDGDMVLGMVLMGIGVGF